MIDRQVVTQQIVAYLNGDTQLSQLVAWAEDALVALTETDSDVPYERDLIRILGYIGAGDSRNFPLTWEVLNDFLHRLDTRVKVTVSAA